MAKMTRPEKSREGVQANIGGTGLGSVVSLSNGIRPVHRLADHTISKDE